MEFIIFLVLCCVGIFIWNGSQEKFQQKYTEKVSTNSLDTSYTPDPTVTIDNAKLSQLLDIEPYYDSTESLPLISDVVVDPDMDTKVL